MVGSLYLKRKAIREQRSDYNYWFRVMEKQTKLRNKILKILPKAAAAVTVTFQNPPFSPGRDHNKRPKNTSKWFKQHNSHVVHMIPDEARRKSKDGGGIDSQEPTSPKVSCMGQIKHKKKQIKKGNAKSMSLPKEGTSTTAFRRMFNGAKLAGRKSDAAAYTTSDHEKEEVPRRSAPALSEMKRFVSGRDSLSNFDWKAPGQVAPEEMDHSDYYSDRERDESDGEEEEVMIPFSAPIIAGGGCDGCAPLQSRKEINLWKRRTMAPPRPLQLNPV